MGRGRDIDSLLYGDTLHDVLIPSPNDEEEDDYAFSLINEIVNYMFQNPVDDFTFKPDKEGVIMLDWDTPFLLYESTVEGSDQQLEVMITLSDPEVPEEWMRPKLGLYTYNEKEHQGKQLYLGDSLKDLCEKAHQQALVWGSSSFFDIGQEGLISALEHFSDKARQK